LLGPGFSTTIDDVLGRIEEMAKSQSRSRSWVIKKAITNFLEYEEWFIHEVQEGLKEMERGEFASDDEVLSRFKKWGVDAG